MDASSEGISEDGRDSAYALEGSQAIEELEKPEDLINVLANGTHFDVRSDPITEEQYKAAESTQQSVNFSGDRVIIDPNLINPPQFIQHDGNLYVTAAPNGVPQEVDP